MINLTSALIDTRIGSIYFTFGLRHSNL